MSGESLTAPQHNGNQQSAKDARFSKVVLGWACVVGCAILLLIIVFSFFSVVRYLTSPPTFLNEHVLTSASGNASLAVTLEYESMVIRTQGVQVAFGLVVGLAFAAIGLLLFAIGALGEVSVSGESTVGKFRFFSTAPGLVVVVLGAAIIALAVNKDVRRDFEASYRSGGEQSYRSSSKRPASSRKGDVPDNPEPCSQPE